MKISVSALEGRVGIAGIDIQGGSSKYYLFIGDYNFCHRLDSKPPNKEGLASYFATAESRIRGVLIDHLTSQDLVKEILTEIRKSIGLL